MLWSSIFTLNVNIIQLYIIKIPFCTSFYDILYIYTSYIYVSSKCIWCQKMSTRSPTNKLGNTIYSGWCNIFQRLLFPPKLGLSMKNWMATWWDASKGGGIFVLPPPGISSCPKFPPLQCCVWKATLFSIFLLIKLWKKERNS